MEFPFTVLSQKNTYLVFKTNKLYLIFLNVQAYWLAQAIGASTETTVSNIDVNVVDNNRLLTLLEAKDYATQQHHQVLNHIQVIYQILLILLVVC